MHECIVTLKIETIQIKSNSLLATYYFTHFPSLEVTAAVSWKYVIRHACVHAHVCTGHTHTLRRNDLALAEAPR